MNAKQIADALARKPNSEECTRLMQACAPARQMIRDRLQQIAPSAAGDPPERTQALLAGPEALVKLDREVEALRFEYSYLDGLESQAAQAYDTAHAAEMRKAIPVSVRKLPGALDHVRAALASLDAAIAELNSHVDIIAQFEVTEDKSLPLTDEQLAELLSLRNEVWTTRQIRGIQPPGSLQDSEVWPLSWPLFYDTRHGGMTIITRRPGSYLPDYTT